MEMGETRDEVIMIVISVNCILVQGL